MCVDPPCASPFAPFEIGFLGPLFVLPKLAAIVVGGFIAPVACVPLRLLGSSVWHGPAILRVGLPEKVCRPRT